VARSDPYEHALESLLVEKQGAFTGAGYGMVMNQDPDKRDEFRDRMLGLYREMNDILVDYAPGETFFFDRFGWSEVIFTPMFMRFWFLEYYEGFELPDGAEYNRVRRWREACLAEPHAQQVTPEEINKLYYDYARGAGNGALPEGRAVSTFAFEPDWPTRPMPPRDKYGPGATDAELGLL
jgi:glutathione S-transferase